MTPLRVGFPLVLLVLALALAIQGPSQLGAQQVQPVVDLMGYVIDDALAGRTIQRTFLDATALGDTTVVAARWASTTISCCPSSCTGGSKRTSTNPSSSTKGWPWPPA